MTPLTGSASIGARLATIAARLPDKIAISDGDARLSYAQLDSGASRLARRILALAAGREGAVCLLFDSRPAAVQAIFGAGRSGRPYVPLDARDPDERLRFIVQDCAPIAMVAEPALRERALALVPPGCAIIDTEEDPPLDDSAIDAVPADAIAYLFYTSGSTGQPKGVSQSHRNLLFFADAYAATLSIDESDRVSLLYSLSFSAANMDIFGGMLKGATLVGYDLRRDGIARLADWLDRERVTVLHAVPTVFRELFASLPLDRKLSHLRAIDLGGESVLGSDVELFRRHTGDGCVLVNHLAATESSVIAQHVVDHRAGPLIGILPVGRTPPGVRVAIRRSDGTAADADEIGEIVVCSRHVSPGYWRRPELNAKAFSEDPDEPGWRRYFTGDLGRIDSEGKLHFLGRTANRIKIRGFSVDLAEVEAALSACAGVISAAVVALRRSPDTEPDRVAAYVVAEPGARRDASALRRTLASRLPFYMLPTAFAFVDALPVTSSGKIDRNALEAIVSADDQRIVEPPRDGVEREVARIFQAMLGPQAVGRDDDFFLLGGDSLSFVELQTRLRDAFGLALSSIHEDATVAGIAALVATRRASVSPARSMPMLVSLRERGGATPLFLVHGRLGQALVSPQFLRLLGDDQPVWAFQARGLDGLHEPHATIEAMAADYVAEMRRQRPEGPYFIGSLCAGALVAIAMARELRAANEVVLPLLLLDPPEQAFAMADRKMTEESLLRRLKRRQARGRIDAPIDDPVYARASVRVAQAFEQAIRRHRPAPYDGPVFMFSSRTRIGSDPETLKRLYAGRVERFDVAITHSQVLDAHDPTFATQLARCLAIVREAARILPATAGMAQR